MIFPFVELPQSPGGWPRPVLDVVVGNMGEVLLPCLVDSGAMNTLLPGWGLLGQLSFFRYFVVTFRAADFELEIEPVQR